MSHRPVKLSVMNRNTPVSWLAMTVRALRFTLSRAKADKTLANRPGLFSRKTDNCLLFGICAPSRGGTERLQFGAPKRDYHERSDRIMMIPRAVAPSF